MFTAPEDSSVLSKEKKAPSASASVDDVPNALAVFKTENVVVSASPAPTIAAEPDSFSTENVTASTSSAASAPVGPNVFKAEKLGESTTVGAT